MKIYQVGGAVRDRLLGRVPNDIDYVVVGASVREMKSAGFRQVGKSFPVFLHPETKAEYALARIEEKTGDGHTDFRFIFTPDVTLAQDLARRDFTCNALAYDSKNRQLTDLFHGRADIENKVLRHIHDDHFQEDPLRVLRLCRFAAQLDFTPAPETLALAKKMVAAGALDFLSRERIFLELKKGLLSDRFDKFLTTAFDCGAFDFLFPSVAYSEALVAKMYAAQGASALVKFAILNFFAKDSTIPGTGFNIPKIYKGFAAASKTHADVFQKITAVSVADAASCVYGMTKQPLPDLSEYVKVFEILFGAAPVQSAYAARIRQVLTDTKAADMPDFKKINKDKDFGEKYKAYCIDILEKDPILADLRR